MHRYDREKKLHFDLVLFYCLEPKFSLLPVQSYQLTHELLLKSVREGVPCRTLLVRLDAQRDVQRDMSLAVFHVAVVHARQGGEDLADRVGPAVLMVRLPDLVAQVLDLFRLLELVEHRLAAYFRRVVVLVELLPGEARLGRPA